MASWWALRPLSMASRSSARSQRSGSNHTTMLPVRGKAYTWRTPVTGSTAFSTATASAGVATSVGVAKRTRPAASDMVMSDAAAVASGNAKLDVSISGTGLSVMFVGAACRRRRRGLLAEPFPGLADDVSSGQPGLLRADLQGPDSAKTHRGGG